MTNNILCLVPVMKPPLLALFDEVLARKNSRVTKKPLGMNMKKKAFQLETVATVKKSCFLIVDFSIQS